MSDTQSDTIRKLDEFLVKLDEIDQYETEQLTPVVLEMTGMLGTLNRLAMHLVQTAITEGTELQKNSDNEDEGASETLERLKLGLRETSERVERAITKLKGKLILVDASINISCDILDYIAQVRKLLTESIWE